MLEMVFKEQDWFDIIHFHIDYLHFPLSRRMRTSHVTTLHGRLDIPDLVNLYKEFREKRVNRAIEIAKRVGMPLLGW